MDTFFFFVPSRLVWDNWQRFCGEQKNPGDSTDFLIPSLSGVNTFTNGSIFDYMGLPTGVALDPTNTPINALPFRAYNLIYNEWFRDENLIDSIPVTTGDGPDPISNYTLRKRAKRHDYFTSALPWPQKGPSVEVGLSGNAPVKGFDKSTDWLFSTPNGVNPDGYLAGIGTKYNGLDSNICLRGWINQEMFTSGGDGSVVQFENLGSYGNQPFVVKDPGTESNYRPITGVFGKDFSFQGALTPKTPNSIYADLSGVNAVTINDLRQAFQIQKFYEKWARGGSRYTETLRVMFNVISPDARLQRPEYLGGTHSRVNVVPTAQTSSTDSVSPQSNLSAFGVLGDSAHGFNKSFVEHGYVIGLCCLRADITYQQGLNRMWSRRQLFDFYWPTLAHLGEQVVYNKEIYTQGTADDNGVFGYQERYAEYRYKPSMITGKLRSTDAQSLDVWHLAQKFDSLPKLNQDFIEENPPINRVIAVQNEPQFFADFWFDLKTSRPMPVYSVPGLVDHF